jgi:hypothetical protein
MLMSCLIPKYELQVFSNFSSTAIVGQFLCFCRHAFLVQVFLKNVNDEILYEKNEKMIPVDKTTL